MGAPIEGPPETPQTSQHYGVEGFKREGILNLALYVERLRQLYA